MGPRIWVHQIGGKGTLQSREEGIDLTNPFWQEATDVPEFNGKKPWLGSLLLGRGILGRISSEKDREVLPKVVLSCKPY